MSPRPFRSLLRLRSAKQCSGSSWTAASKASYAQARSPCSTWSMQRLLNARVIAGPPQVPTVVESTGIVCIQADGGVVVLARSSKVAQIVSELAAAGKGTGILRVQAQGRVEVLARSSKVAQVLTEYAAIVEHT